MKLCMITYVGITEEAGKYLVNDKIGRMADDLALHFEHVYFVGSATKKRRSDLLSKRAKHTHICF